MLNIYKYCLGPILLGQAKWLRATAARLPEASGPRSGVHSAEKSTEVVRVLFVGDSSAAGVGVPEQTQALAHQAAERLSRKLEVNVHWQLIAKSGVNTKEALELIENSDIQAADVLVTALGTNDVTSQRKPRQFIQDYQKLVGRLMERTGLRHVVVTGLPPLRVLPAAPHPLRWYLGKYATSLDQSLRTWVKSTTNFRYVSLEWAAVPSEMAIDKFHPGEGQYRKWADMVAENIASLIPFPNSLPSQDKHPETIAGSSTKSDY